MLNTDVVTEIEFLYWFFDEEWWMGASQGAIGALIGFGGLLAAYVVTHRGDRRRRRQEQTVNAVAAIIQTSLALHQKQPDEIEKEDFDTLEKELMLFCAYQLEYRPEVAHWARKQSNLIRRRSRYEHGALAAREHSGRFVTDLAEWLAEGCPNGVLRPDDVQDQWDSIIVEIEEEKKKRLESAPTAEDA